MKTKSGQWFECKVRYERMQENGTTKKVTEAYVVDALSFTEAEARIIDEMTAYISGEFAVCNINPTPFKEIVFVDDATADKYFKVKVGYITINEKTGKEKVSNTTYLVQAKNTDEAQKATHDMHKGGVQDYVIKSVTETKILDVYEHTINN